MRARIAEGKGTKSDARRLVRQRNEYHADKPIAKAVAKGRDARARAHEQSAGGLSLFPFRRTLADCLSPLPLFLPSASSSVSTSIRSGWRIRRTDRVHHRLTALSQAPRHSGKPGVHHGARKGMRHAGPQRGSLVPSACDPSTAPLFSDRSDLRRGNVTRTAGRDKVKSGSSSAVESLESIVRAVLPLRADGFSSHRQITNGRIPHVTTEMLT